MSNSSPSAQTQTKRHPGAGQVYGRWCKCRPKTEKALLPRPPLLKGSRGGTNQAADTPGSLTRVLLDHFLTSTPTRCPPAQIHSPPRVPTQPPRAPGAAVLPKAGKKGVLANLPGKCDCVLQGCVTAGVPVNPPPPNWESSETPNEFESPIEMGSLFITRASARCSLHQPYI